MSINRSHLKQANELPIKVLQFGSGVFLRGYFDWFVQQMNERGQFNGAVSMVKLTPRGDLTTYAQQEGVYQHIIRGVQNGVVVNETQHISVLQDWIHPYQEWQRFITSAQSPDLNIIVSNSTEAGIRYEACERPTSCPDSFPAKLCAWLAARYESQTGPVWVLPFELIENNGDQLRLIVLRHAQDWSLDAACIQWLESQVYFVNTLVDRIVAAPSAEERTELCANGLLPDELMNASEPYHILVLDADEAALEPVLPLKAAGLNVVYSKDLPAYRERKVKLLNGAHTSMLFLSYLRGNNTVEDSLNDEAIAGFLKSTLYDEVIPTIAMPRAELEAYADSVLERFRNPFLKHQLLSISLNSISKIQHRVLRTLLDAVEQGQSLPQRLCLAFASCLHFYHGSWQGDDYLAQRGSEVYAINDDPDQLRELAAWWASVDGGLDLASALSDLLARTALWGHDLHAIPGLTETVLRYLNGLESDGVDAALALLPV